MARTKSTLITQPCYFLQIAPELRLIIFRLVFEDKAVRMLIASKGYIEEKSNSTRKERKAILTCKQLYKELEPLLFDCTVFEISFNRDSDPFVATLPGWRKRTYKSALSVFNRARRVDISAGYDPSRIANFTGAPVVHPQLGQLFLRLNAGKTLRQLTLDLRVENDRKASDAEFDKFLGAFKAKRPFVGNLEVKLTIMRPRKVYGGQSFDDLLDRFGSTKRHAIMDSDDFVTEWFYGKPRSRYVKRT